MNDGIVNTQNGGNPYVLEVRRLSKSFGGVRALDDVQWAVRRGQVHALMGENGAGKSTLMNILAGLVAPDSGEIRFNGRPVRILNPHQARQLGIAMIHQELLPFPGLTVAENIFMGQEPASRGIGWIHQRKLRQQAAAALQRLGVTLSPEAKMKELNVAAMQMVEIAKALVSRAQVLIMDEPTSAISHREIEALFAIIRELKAAGVAVVFISHKLEEVFRIADTVTVLRDGQHAATEPIGALDEPRLISLMVGRPLPTLIARSGATAGPVALTARGLTQPGKFHDVELEVHQGEVVGLAGLLGAGRTELLQALYGLAPAKSGEILINGQAVRIGHPRDAIHLGLALVSEDRKQDGLVLKLPVKHNLTLANLQRCSRFGWLNRAAENALADQQIQALGVKIAHREQLVSQLSGGNQQRVVLAKALLTEPQILLLDEPTRGIDIGAKFEIYALIRRLAQAGLAILLASSELPELLALSDRILVMRQGRLSAELDPSHTTQEHILSHAMPR